jgi:hypothetical protein
MNKMLNLRTWLALATLLWAGVAHGQVAPNSTFFFVKQDNTIYENANLSNGLGDSLFAGTSGTGGGTNIMRSLIEIDLPGAFAEEIPEGARIIDVTLVLTVDTPKLRTGVVNLHRLTRGWGEGTSHANQGEAGGDTPTANDATWTEAFLNTTNWTTAGGDFLSAVSASTNVTANGPIVVTSPGLAADLQFWLDNPTENHGWIIRLEDESLPAIRFGSHDNADPQLRPFVEVQYAIPLPALITDFVQTNGLLQLTVESVEFDLETLIQYNADLTDTNAWTTISSVSNLVEGGVILVDPAPLPNPVNLRLESIR